MGRIAHLLSAFLTEARRVKMPFTTKIAGKPKLARTGTRPALLLVFPMSVPQTLFKGRIDSSSGLASVRPFPFPAQEKTAQVAPRGSEFQN